MECMLCIWYGGVGDVCGCMCVCMCTCVCVCVMYMCVCGVCLCVGVGVYDPIHDHVCPPVISTSTDC